MKYKNSNKEELYKKDGFILIENFFQPMELNAITQELNRLFSASSKKGNEKNCLYTNIKETFKENIDCYLNTARHSAKLISLQNILSSSKVQRLAKEFDLHCPTSPTSPVFHYTSSELKIPNGYFGVGAHQDWPSIQGGLRSIVIWIPFMDIKNNNYPLEILPGSHKRGLIEGKINTNSYELALSAEDENNLERISMKYGDILVMSVFTVHRTAIENCSGFRLACSIRLEDSMEQSFIDRMYPCAYQRHVERKFITPNFPETDNIKEIFD